MAGSRTSDERWTIRGIPAGLQRQAKTAADRRGMKLGAWVSAAVRAALDAEARPRSAGSHKRRADIEDVARRVARVEKAIAALSKKAGTGRGAGSEAAAPLITGEVDTNTPEFKALIRKLFLERLHGKSATTIQKALGVTEAEAKVLSTVRPLV